jgi:hypothetical protein
VLFSNDAIAGFINDRFEPVWQSVRGVPTVTIDFGGGRSITRTLNGNIAAYVCFADGAVLDVLPGIYAPEVFREELERMALRHSTLAGRGDRGAALRAYHAEAEETILERSVIPIEVLRGGSSATAGPVPRASELGGWEALRADTRVNEFSRRLAIHGHLKALDAPRPEDLTRWLYREVLHADLDDPYLGLGETLFGSYPFAEEDAG